MKRIIFVLSFVFLSIEAHSQITSQPFDTSACVGSNTSFNVSVNGMGSIIWQCDTGSGWQSISNGGSYPTYSGVSSFSLKLSNLAVWNNGYKFRCVTSNLDTSNTAILTVKTKSVSPTSINISSASICRGQNATLTVNGGNLGTNASWKWFKDNCGGLSAGSSSAIIVSPNFSSIYYLRAEGDCNTTICVSAILKVDTLPNILSNPTNKTICAGSSTNFSISANGSSITYQWQVNSGSGWSNITTTGTSPAYTGFNGNTLTLSNVATTNNNYQYRCQVSGICSPTATSSSALLTVLSQPTIIANPNPARICEGSGTSFSVSANGSGLTYQWQYNSGSGWNSITSSGSGPSYSNYFTSTLGVSTVVLSNNGYQYRCLVSGTCSPSVFSQPAKLSIDTLPKLIDNPVSVTACEGLCVNFKVKAEGSGLTYQWQVNSGFGWTNITSSGSFPNYSNYYTDNLQVCSLANGNNGYQYRCIVNGLCNNSVISNSATLSVKSNARITMDANDSSVCEGSNSQFTIKANGSGLIYNWQILQGLSWSDINVSNSVPYFNNYNTESLEVKNIAPWYDGTMFRCIVSGTCLVNDTSVPVKINIDTKPKVYSEPMDMGVCEFNSTSFEVIAGASNINYNWQLKINSDWVDFSNQSRIKNFKNEKTQKLVIDSCIEISDGSQLRCIVSNKFCPSISTIPVYLSVFSNPTISLANTLSLCRGDSILLHPVILDSLDIVEYRWSPAIGISNIKTSNTIVFPYSSTIYSLEIVDKNKCIGINKIAVNVNNLPTANAGRDTSICKGQGALLNSSGGVFYKWSPSNGLSNSNIRNPIAFPNSSIIYNVEVTDSNGCKSNDDVRVVVNDLPIVKANNDTSVCFGSDLQLMAKGAVYYEWFPNKFIDNSTINSPICSPETDIDYILEGFDIKGCKNYDTLKIKVHDLPNVYTKNDTAICFGDSLTLIGFGANYYKWKIQTEIEEIIRNQINVKPINDDLVILQGIDLNGCKNSDSVYIKINKIQQVDVGEDLKACKGDTIQLTAKGSSIYEWFPSRLVNDSSIYNPIFLATNTSGLKVKARDINNCISYDSVFIEVVELPKSRIIGDSIVCSNKSWVNYSVIGQNKFTWNVFNGDIQTGQFTKSIFVHWSKDTNDKVVYLMTELREYPYCVHNDSLYIKTSNGVAPDGSLINFKSNNQSTKILVSKQDSYKYYFWGYELKNSNLEVYTCKGKNWCYFPDLDLNNYYYWCYVGDDSLCLSKSYLFDPNVATNVNSEELFRTNIYPNPSNGIVIIDTPFEIFNIKLATIDGVVLNEINIVKNKSILNLEEMPNGFYILILETSNGIDHFKILLNK